MLDKIDLFADLTNRELEDIQKITRRLSVRRGDIIFSQGEFTRDFFIIETGQVDIAVKDQLQELHIIATLKSGDFFGEMALFDKNSPRSATARSAQNSTLLQIPGTDFESLLQQKPNLSFKLLGALSRRLRETNQRALGSNAPVIETNAKVISIASPRTGDGKTTLAMTLAHHLSKEHHRKVLYLDLDLTFADGTYFMGVYSIKTICDLVAHLPKINDFVQLSPHLVSLSENLFVVPGTLNVIDGERIRPEQFVSLLKICRKLFDYIIIDTESKIEDVFLSALDLSDRLLFLVDPRDVFTIKCASRYFAGIRKLNYADERMAIIATKAGESFKPEHLEKLLKMRVFGALPLIPDYVAEYGVTPFQKYPDSAYMEFIREMSAKLFHESSPKTSGKGFLTRLFFGSGQNTEKGVAKAHTETCGLEFPAITPENLRVILKYVRVTFLNGQFNEARQQTIDILDYCPKSPLVYQLLGEIHQAEGNVSDSIECFRKAMDLDPKNHMAIGYLGILGNDETLFQRATEVIRAKIQEHPTYPDLHKELGLLFLARKMFEPAAAAFRMALEVNPRYNEARIHLADTLGQEGKYQEAVDLLSAIPQKSIRVFYLLGTHLHALGRFSESIQAYKMVAKINPSYEDTTSRLETLDGYFAKVRSLIAMHEEIIRTRPSFPDIHMKLGMMYVVVGRRSDAEKSFRKALELNPKYEDARRYLDTLNQNPEIQLVEAEQRTHPEHPCHSVVCKGFSLHFQLGDWAQKPEERLNLENHLVTVQNVRTNKSQTIRLTSELIGKGTFDVSAEGICPIADGDLVVARIIDPNNSQPLMTIPHFCDSTKVPTCSFAIELKEPLRLLASKLGAVPPVQYFLINLESANLSQILGGAKGEYHAFVENPRNGIKAEGIREKDSPATLSFVLRANDTETVVLPGDRLRLQVLDEKGSPLLNWDFAVLPHDIQAFRKVIVLDSAAAASSAV